MTYIEDIEQNKWQVFVIHDDYKWVLLTVAIQIFHYYVIVVGAGSPRSKLFPQEFMEEKFGQEHSQALNGAKIMKGGYPDHGSGRYTMALGYSGWMEFNKAQRIHYNYLETINQMICMVLMCGLYFPRTTTAINSVYILGRVGFQVGYKLFGPKGRMAAVPIVMLTQFLLPIFTMVSVYKLATIGSNDIVQATQRFQNAYAEAA